MTVQDMIDKLNDLPLNLRNLDLIFSIRTEPGVFEFLDMIDNSKHFGDPVVEIEIVETRN
jgi:hypothetical protein